MSTEIAIKTEETTGMTGWISNDSSPTLVKPKEAKLESASPSDAELAAKTERPNGALHTRILSGSALLVASATLVNLGNYLFNLILGRWLGPAAFADLSLIVTLFLMTSFVTSAFQTPAARFAAIFTAEGDSAQLSNLRRWLVRLATGFGLGFIVLFVVGAPLWSRFFETDSLVPFVIFGLFVPFYIVQGVDRGLLQGRTRFGWLALTYQGEMWSRLILSMILVGLGLSVNGAVLGIGLSFVVAWLLARHVRIDLPRPSMLDSATSAKVLTFAGPVLIAQLSQILINNSDILIVRRFYPAEMAGQYAALALMGRIVFFATWSIVIVMFPIVTQRSQRGEAHRYLLYLALGIVLLISAVLVAGAYLFPEQIVQLLFGPAYLSVAPYLWLYALATMFYALANVVIHYRLALGEAWGTYIAVGAGVSQILLLWLFHESLLQVVLLQLGLMALLFFFLILWDSIKTFTAVSPFGDANERL